MSRTCESDQFTATNLLQSWFLIKMGVRQGCVMSPDLLSLYSKMILRQLEGQLEGVLISGSMTSILPFADDTVLLTSSTEDLQLLFDDVTVSSERLGLQINSKKTKVRSNQSQETSPVSRMQHRITPIEQVNLFNYLEALVTTDACFENEIRCRRGILAITTTSTLLEAVHPDKSPVAQSICLVNSFIWL